MDDKTTLKRCRARRIRRAFHGQMERFCTDQSDFGVICLTRHRTVQYAYRLSTKKDIRHVFIT